MKQEKDDRFDPLSSEEWAEFNGYILAVIDLWRRLPGELQSAWLDYLISATDARWAEPVVSSYLAKRQRSGELEDSDPG